MRSNARNRSGAGSSGPRGHGRPHKVTRNSRKANNNRQAEAIAQGLNSSSRKRNRPNVNRSMRNRPNVNRSMRNRKQDEDDCNELKRRLYNRIQLYKPELTRIRKLMKNAQQPRPEMHEKQYNRAKNQLKLFTELHNNIIESLKNGKCNLKDIEKDIKYKNIQFDNLQALFESRSKIMQNAVDNLNLSYSAGDNQTLHIENTPPPEEPEDEPLMNKNSQPLKKSRSNQRAQ
jgi:hypothetical protein